MKFTYPPAVASVVLAPLLANGSITRTFANRAITNYYPSRYLCTIPNTNAGFATYIGIKNILARDYLLYRKPRNPDRKRVAELSGKSHEDCRTSFPLRYSTRYDVYVQRKDGDVRGFLHDENTAPVCPLPELGEIQRSNKTVTTPSKSYATVTKKTTVELTVGSVKFSNLTEEEANQRACELNAAFEAGRRVGKLEFSPRVGNLW